MSEYPPSPEESYPPQPSESVPVPQPSDDVAYTGDMTGDIALAAMILMVVGLIIIIMAAFFEKKKHDQV